ncbi:MAG: TIGR02147 family protein [Myxococcota bacterium]
MHGEANPMDYRSYLRKILQLRGLKQIDFAQMLNMSPAWLSQILNGRRKLDPALAEKIVESLSLNERARLEFLSLVEHEVGNSKLIRGRAKQLLTGMQKPEAGGVTTPEFQQQLGTWHVGAILELARCEEYVPDPDRVAATLRPRITAQQAKEAMDCLRENGYFDEDYRLIREQDAGTKRQVDKGRQSEVVAQYHRVSFDLAQRALMSVPETDRLILGGTLALAEEDFRELRTRFEEFVVPTLLASARNPPNRVYQVTTALFPVSLYSDAVADPRSFTDERP